MEIKQLITKIEGEIRERKALLAALRAYDPVTSDQSHKAGGNSHSPRAVHHRTAPQLSPEGRKRIADAQLKRWAAAKSQKKSAAKG